MTRLIHYIRVSDLGERDPEAERTQTIRQQREGAQAITALTPGAQIIEEVVALNASGGKAWPEPQLAEAIARVDRGEADGIVVYDLTRWGRHLDALAVIERWADEGKVFLSASDKFDATTANGRMALRMMMVVARGQWESIRDRFAESQAGAIRRGAYLHRTPLGYERNDDGTLREDPVLGPVVSEAFRIAAAGDLHAAADHLAAHVPDRRWSTDDTRRLLGLRAYLGESHLGDLEPNLKAHVPLTTLATWQAAQTEPRARRSNGAYPLSQLARCGRCGEGLTGQLQSVNGRSYRRMRCSSATCKGGTSISADKLEAHVRGWLDDLLADDAFRVRLDVEGVDEAHQALEQAISDRQAFASDVAFLRALGPEAARVNAEALTAEVQRAEEAFREVAARAAQSLALPTREQLADPEGLSLAARAAVAAGLAIVVRPGRGTIAERVPLDDLDNGPGVLAA